MDRSDAETYRKISCASSGLIRRLLVWAALFLGFMEPGQREKKVRAFYTDQLITLAKNSMVILSQGHFPSSRSYSEDASEKR